MQLFCRFFVFVSILQIAVVVVVQVYDKLGCIVIVKDISETLIEFV